jgi:hypothetical protein
MSSVSRRGLRPHAWVRWWAAALNWARRQAAALDWARRQVAAPRRERIWAHLAGPWASAAKPIHSGPQGSPERQVWVAEFLPACRVA